MLVVLLRPLSFGAVEWLAIAVTSLWAICYALWAISRSPERR